MGATTFFLLEQEKKKRKEEQKPATIDYSELTVDELKDIAKDRGIEGYYKMKKTELVEAIKGGG